MKLVFFVQINTEPKWIDANRVMNVQTVLLPKGELLKSLMVNSEKDFLNSSL